VSVLAAGLRDALRDAARVLPSPAERRALQALAAGLSASGLLPAGALLSHVVLPCLELPEAASGERSGGSSEPVSAEAEWGRSALVLGVNPA
jgi:hypothetical protein